MYPHDARVTTANETTLNKNTHAHRNQASTRKRAREEYESRGTYLQLAGAPPALLTRRLVKPGPDAQLPLLAEVVVGDDIVVANHCAG